jgi:hypothetical protein
MGLLCEEMRDEVVEELGLEEIRSKYFLTTREPEGGRDTVINHLF